MEMNRDESWLESMVQMRDDYEIAAVDRFTGRLLGLAKNRLPERLRRRVDPDDIVQSVFRSFFERHQSGQFQFGSTTDVWRLLAAITFHKVQKSIRHHSRQQRDVGREITTGTELAETEIDSPTASSLVMMMELLDQIMAEIPESHQDIVRLRLENYSIEEVAERAQVSTRTVQRTLERVRNVATQVYERS